MKSRVRFNGRKTKSEGERDTVDRQIDIVCGRKCVDTFLVVSCFGSASFCSIKDILDNNVPLIWPTVWGIHFLHRRPLPVHKARSMMGRCRKLETPDWAADLN